MRKNEGFTLIEIMIVLAIITILTTIAVPAYQNSATRARRSDAQGALLGLAAAMERRFSESSTYCNNGTVAATGTDDCVDASNTGDTGAPTIYAQTIPIDGGAVNYDLVIQTVSRARFEVRATRRVGGPMENDDCGDFTYTQTGRKGQNGGSMDCW